MTQGDGQSVGRVVRLRKLSEAQKPLDHVLYLGLFRGSRTGQGQLHLLGGVFKDGETGMRRRQDADPAGVPDQGECLGVLGEVEYFHRDRLRLELPDEFGKLTVDRFEPILKRHVFGRLEAAKSFVADPS